MGNLTNCRDIYGSTLIGSKFSQPLMLSGGGISLAFFGVFTTVCSIINSVSSYFTTKFEKIPFGIIMLVHSIIILTIGVSQNRILVLLLFVTAACRGIGNIKITAKLNERISIDSVTI